MNTTRTRLRLVAALAAVLAAGAAEAAEKLRLLTWADYVPADVREQFTRETGI